MQRRTRNNALIISAIALVVVLIVWYMIIKSKTKIIKSLTGIAYDPGTAGTGATITFTFSTSIDEYLGISGTAGTGAAPNPKNVSLVSFTTSNTDIQPLVSALTATAFTLTKSAPNTYATSMIPSSGVPSAAVSGTGSGAIKIAMV